MGTRETNNLVDELNQKAALVFYFLDGLCDADEIQGFQTVEIINRINAVLDEARHLKQLAERTHEEFWDVEACDAAMGETAHGSAINSAQAAVC